MGNSKGESIENLTFLRPPNTSKLTCYIFYNSSLCCSDLTYQCLGEKTPFRVTTTFQDGGLHKPLLLGLKTPACSNVVKSQEFSEYKL